MVVLNVKLPINVLEMKKVVLEELEYIIKDEIDGYINYDDKKRDIKIEKLTKNIIKGMENKFYSDFFISRMLDENHCIYKHKWGKKDGNICCKKITKNGDKNNNVCTKHNKMHTPQTKIVKKDIINVDLKNKIHDGSINVKNANITLSNDNKIGVLNVNNRCNKNIIYKNKKDKNININNLILNNFKKIIIDYNNVIVCKYNGRSNCHNIIKYGFCNFKHFNNIIPIDHYINQNNNLLSI